MALNSVYSACFTAESSTACWGRKRQARNGHAKGEQKQSHLPRIRVAQIQIHSDSSLRLVYDP